jgi:hypothetical protein
MPKTLKPVTVTFSTSGANCNPDPVPVTRSLNNGVKWTSATAGYTFTGIDITTGNANDFGTPSVGTNAAGKSVMSVTDSVADLGDYSYTLNYTDPAGNSNNFDPTIRNKT